MTVVLDASAWLSYLLDEPSAATIEDLVVDGAVMSAVNLAEVCSQLGGVRPDVAAVIEQVATAARDAHSPYVTSSLPVLPETVEVIPFTEADAWTAGGLSLPARCGGLSLGDRACLALARRLGHPVVTTNRRWLGLDEEELGIKVVVVPA